MSDILKSQIHHVKQWNTDALFTSYLTHLLLKFIQVMTNFKSIFEDFFLSWVKVESLLSLVQALWSWIDHWLTWFSDFSSNASYENDKSLLDESLLDTVEKDQFNMIAQDFLHLLKKLCIVILQNLIIYHQEFSVHFLWKDSLFVQDDYLTFANEVKCYEHVWINQSSDLILINLIKASHDVMSSLNLAHLFESFSFIHLFHHSFRQTHLIYYITFVSSLAQSQAIIYRRACTLSLLYS